VEQAETALARYGCPISFREHFQDSWHERSVDLLRPNGGKYPGVSGEVDRSLDEQACNRVDASKSDIDPELTSNHSFRAFDGKAALHAEQAEEAATSTASGPARHSVWIELKEGKRAHKKTILRVFMDAGYDVDHNRSHDRLLRIRYFSIGGDNLDRLKPQIHSGLQVGVFRLGSLFATLVCVNQTCIAVAILQCTLLKSGSQYIDCAPVDELSLPKSSYEISGQILYLVPYVTKAEASGFVCRTLLGMECSVCGSQCRNHKNSEAIVHSSTSQLELCS
jgi:hypothetical protein